MDTSAGPKVDATAAAPLEPALCGSRCLDVDISRVTRRLITIDNDCQGQLRGGGRLPYVSHKIHATNATNATNATKFTGFAGENGDKIL